MSYFSHRRSLVWRTRSCCIQLLIYCAALFELKLEFPSVNCYWLNFKSGKCGWIEIMTCSKICIRREGCECKPRSAGLDSHLELNFQVNDMQDWLIVWVPWIVCAKRVVGRHFVWCRYIELSSDSSVCSYHPKTMRVDVLYAMKCIYLWIWVHRLLHVCDWTCWKISLNWSVLISAITNLHGFEHYDAWVVLSELSFVWQCVLTIQVYSLTL